MQAMTIPAHLLFDGAIPHEAQELAGQLAKMEPEKSSLSEWQRARLGKITASHFGDVKYLKSGAWGETALTYLYDLIGEHLTGQPSESFTGSKATEWGNQYEEEALTAYKQRTGRKTKPGHFLQDPKNPLVGGTPDAFCGEQGVLEVKCPFNFKNHLRTVITKKVPDDYMPQVLGHLMLSGREWCDFVSYDPRIKSQHRLVIVRVKAKEVQAEMDELAQRIIDFHKLLLKQLEVLKIKSIHPIKY